MDIAAFSLKPTADMLVRNPISGLPLKNEDGSEMTITVHGSDSEKYRSEMFYVKRDLVEKTEELKEDPFHASEETTVRLLARLVDGWNITLDGEQPELTEELAQEVFTKYNWLRDQVDRFVHRKENFT